MLKNRFVSYAVCNRKKKQAQIQWTEKELLSLQSHLDDALENQIISRYTNIVYIYCI